MRKYLLAIWYFCWHAIVSLEFLISLLAVCVYWYCSIVQELFASIKTSNELKLFLVAIPIAVSVWIFSEVRKIWWPDVDNKAVLMKWSDYPRLKICCVVANLYAFGCSALAIIGTVFENSLHVGVGLYLLITSIIVVLVDASSCWLATLSIQQILESSRKDAP